MNQHTRMCTKMFIKQTNKQKGSAIVETSKNQNTDPSYLSHSFFGPFSFHLSSYFPGFYILDHVLSPPRMQIVCSQMF